MAITDSFHTATAASATNTTKVSPAVAIPDNCHTIIIYNPDGTNDVYVAVGAAGSGALSAATSTIIAKNSSLTMIVGVKSDRPNPSGQLVYSTSAASIAVNITYISSTVM